MITAAWISGQDLAERRRIYNRGQPLAVDLAVDEEPPIGAHLVTPRRRYCHHGIYVGDGMVVHNADCPGRSLAGRWKKFLSRASPVGAKCTSSAALAPVSTRTR